SQPEPVSNMAMPILATMLASQITVKAGWLNAPQREDSASAGGAAVLIFALKSFSRRRRARRGGATRPVDFDPEQFRELNQILSLVAHATAPNPAHPQIDILFDRATRRPRSLINGRLICHTALSPTFAPRR